MKETMIYKNQWKFNLPSPWKINKNTVVVNIDVLQRKFSLKLLKDFLILLFFFWLLAVWHSIHFQHISLDVLSPPLAWPSFSPPPLGSHIMLCISLFHPSRFSLICFKCPTQIYLINLTSPTMLRASSICDHVVFSSQYISCTVNSLTFLSHTNKHT